MSEPTQPNNPSGNNPGPWNPGQPAPGQPGQGGQPGQPGQPGPNQGGQPYPGTPGNYNYPGSGSPAQGNYAYQGNPFGQSAPAEEPARPKQVNQAFWLLIASAVLGLIALPFALVYVNSPEYLDTVEETLRSAGLDVDSEALSNGVAAGTLTAVFSGILGLAVRVALALLVRAGYNWARIIITIFAVFSLFGLIGLFSTGTLSGIITLLATLATIAAVVLLWMKPSSEYFTKKKAYRQAKKFGNYSA